MTTRARSDQLDAMTEADKEADLLASIRTRGAVHLDRRSQVAFWGDALARLLSSGQVKVRDTGSDDQQYTCYEVTLA